MWVARIKQKRGYKDQWPWNIKIYTDEQGNNKGDVVLTYEDPSAAHSAGCFYNNTSSGFSSVRFLYLQIVYHLKKLIMNLAFRF